MENSNGKTWVIRVGRAEDKNFQFVRPDRTLSSFLEEAQRMDKTAADHGSKFYTWGHPFNTDRDTSNASLEAFVRSLGDLTAYPDLDVAADTAMRDLEIVLSVFRGTPFEASLTDARRICLEIVNRAGGDL